MKKLFGIVLLIGFGFAGTIGLGELTTLNTTSSYRTNQSDKFTFQYVITNISTNVVMRAEGSLDNTNFFNLNDDETDTTYTANGTYMMHKDNFKAQWVRARLVSEVDTTVTVDVKLEVN